MTGESVAGSPGSDSFAGAGEVDFCRLYAELTQRDDETASLTAAEHFLAVRLARLTAQTAAVAECGGAQQAAVRAPSVPPRYAAADHGASGSLPSFGESWLASEAVVLQRIVQAETGDDPLRLSLFDVYRRWRSALSADFPAAISDHGPGGSGHESGLPWEPAVIRHALSCSPGRRLPEMLGYLHAALQRMARLSAPAGPGGASPPQPDPLPCPRWPWVAGLAGELPAIGDAIACLLQRNGPGSAERTIVTDRLALGAALNESLWAEVIGARRQPRVTDPAGEVIRILQRKARYGAGFHASVPLAGRSLDDWFGAQPFDGAAFLEALARSPWVDRANPECSRILQLLEFEGPMFGIFSETERHSLHAWLDSLPASPEAASPAGCAAGAQDAGEPTRPEPPAVVSGPERLVRASTEWTEPTRSSRRNLYFRLLNVERDSAVLPIARKHAAACLSAAARGWLPPRRFPYSEQRFADWLDRKYRKQLRKSGNPRRRPLLSRDAYRYGIEQLAPAILVDGCWLQRVEQLYPDMPQVARRLAAIYADELGGGVCEHNHPRVYRRLLESLGIDLPPVASPEFARHPAFLDSAFDLPVFMLSISLSPHRFLPELLGLNLAIELSGLGTAYSRVAGDLDHWGIDSRIVRLHQSIDNLAGGHAALARDCVMLHLGQVRALGGEPAVQQQWRRIWAGYLSLGAVTRGFRWQLVLRYAGMAAAKQIGRLTGLAGPGA